MFRKSNSDMKEVAGDVMTFDIECGWLNVE